MNCENVASVKRFSMLPLVRCLDARIQARNVLVKEKKWIFKIRMGISQITCMYFV